MAGRRSYHHGDLKRELLVAAEAELTEKGLEGFTLRGCAKRAGVSHAAPAHHFKDTAAILTALASIAQSRLRQAMLDRHERAAKDAVSQYVASGIGYVEFALASPALFKLLFGSERPYAGDPHLLENGQRTFGVLLADLAALRGSDPLASAEGMVDIANSWAIVHGIANLLIAGRLDFLRPWIENDLEGLLTAMLTTYAGRSRQAGAPGSSGSGGAK